MRAPRVFSFVQHWIILSAWAEEAAEGRVEVINQTPPVWARCEQRLRASGDQSEEQESFFGRESETNIQLLKTELTGKNNLII